MSNATPVLPPQGAQSANDLWDIVLPTEVETINRNTHSFGGEEFRCWGCDSRMGGQWARFACKYQSHTEAISFEEWVK